MIHINHPFSNISADRNGVISALGGPKCVFGGRSWANGYAQGSGANGSAYVTANHNTYDAWLDAKVSGYFAVWNGDTFSYGWRNAGTRLGTSTYNNKTTVRVCYVYI